MKTVLKTVAAALAARRRRRMARRRPSRSRSASRPSPIRRSTSPDASGKWVGWEVEFIDAVCDEAKLDCVHHADRLGRHHPGADDQEDRRDHRLDVDHRRAQEDDRLLRQVLQHADRHHRPEGPDIRRHAGRPQGQDHRRPGVDRPRRLRQEAFRRQRPPRSRNTRRRTRPTRISPPAASTPCRPIRSRSTPS